MYESYSGIYGAVFHCPYSTLPEGMNFTWVMFSCKQYGDIIAARVSHQVLYISAGTASTEPGTGPTTGTGLREIDVRRQRSSVPSKSLKDGPKMAVFKQERACKYY